MIVVLFSDVHAITQAIDALEQDLKQLKIGGETYRVDQLWCLGDLVGYGPRPSQILSQVHQLLDRYPGSICLRGNHDETIVEIFTTGLRSYRIPTNGTSIAATQEDIVLSQLNKEARTLLINQSTILRDQKEIDWLKELPLRAAPRSGIMLAHGSYEEESDDQTVWSYATKSTEMRRRQIEKLCQNTAEPVQLVAVGHRHIPGLWQFDRSVTPTTETEITDLWRDSWIDFILDANKPLMINPGSISIPRDQGTEDPTPRYASYVVLNFLDQNQLQMNFRRLFYDVEPLIGEDGAIRHYPTSLMRDTLLRQIAYGRSNNHHKGESHDEKQQ